MGLTVLASPDPLLALLSPTGAGAGDAAPPDAFQALLGELLGQAPADSGSTTPATTDALPLPAARPKDESDSTDSAAVLEAMAALQPLATPAISTPLPEARTGAADAPVSGIGGDPLKEQPEIAVDTSQAQPGLAEAAPELQDASPSDAVVTRPAPAAGDALAAEQPGQATAAPSASAATEAQAPAEAPAATPPIDFKAVFESRSQKLEHHEKRDKASDDDAAAPPGDPPPTPSQPASSVVRSVGNAHENKADDNNGHAFGHQEQKPQPKASVEGIAHSSEHSVLHRTETADVSAPDAPQQPARPELQPAVEQVARAVIEKVEAGGGEAKLHLHPAELGEITIHVHADGDQVQVHIHADRPEAAQLIREHTVDLSSMLGQQGLNLADVNVSLGQPGSGNANSREQQPAPNRPGNSDFAALMGIGDTAATDRFNRVRAAYNPNGAFDYRI